MLRLGVIDLAALLGFTASVHAQVNHSQNNASQSDNLMPCQNRANSQEAYAQAQNSDNTLLICSGLGLGIKGLIVVLLSRRQLWFYEPRESLNRQCLS